jgi:hypothetical protein
VTALAQPPIAAPVDMSARAAAIVLFASAAAMLVGVVSFRWFSRGDGGVGLAGVQNCVWQMCHTTMWTNLHRAPSEYALFGYAGLLSLVGGLALSIHAGVRLLQDRAPLAKVRTLNALLAIAAFATIAFWMRVELGEHGHRLTIGYAGFVTLAGVVVAGTVAHRTVRRLAIRVSS